MLFRTMGALAGEPASAVNRRLEEESEEEMTYPDTGDEIRFEYKIIRSAAGAFKNPAKFTEVLAEEARAGWELLEKLSDHRARLRRHVQWRGQDATLTQDPYRITIGIGEDALMLRVLFGSLAVIGLIVGVVMGLL